MLKHTVKDIFKCAVENHMVLFPTVTGFDFWNNVYTNSTNTLYDQTFARLFASFYYNDWLNDDPDITAFTSLTHFQFEFISLLTLNRKKYEELYRLHIVTNDEAPYAYNYDMEEHFGVTHTEVKFTKGEQENTTGETTDTHKVAPMNTSTPLTESQDVTDQHTFTDGEREDSTETDTDEIVNTRKGNIGVQTFADIAGGFVDFWDGKYKFMMEIFNDICKQMLQVNR